MLGRRVRRAQNTILIRAVGVIRSKYPVFSSGGCHQQSLVPKAQFFGSSATICENRRKILFHVFRRTFWSASIEQKCSRARTWVKRGPLKIGQPFRRLVMSTDVILFWNREGISRSPNCGMKRVLWRAEYLSIFPTTTKNYGYLLYFRCELLYSPIGHDIILTPWTAERRDRNDNVPTAIVVSLRAKRYVDQSALFKLFWNRKYEFVAQSLPSLHMLQIEATVIRSGIKRKKNKV